MLILSGRKVPVPGVAMKSWLDDPRLKLGPEDGKRRTEPWIRMVVVHTTQGRHPTVVNPGAGPDLGAERRTVEIWKADSRHAGAHVIIDADGSAACICDVVDHMAYHAKSTNPVSVGIEIKQTTKGEIWEVQLDVLVKVVDVLTRELGIQRQVHLPYRGGPITRLAQGGDDCVGVFGHRDQSSNRGRGDPGDPVMEALVAAGYESYDFSAGVDRATWGTRQRVLVDRGVYAGKIDGVPGPATRSALLRVYKTHGLWVARPGD